MTLCTAPPRLNCRCQGMQKPITPQKQDRGCPTLAPCPAVPGTEEALRDICQITHEALSAIPIKCRCRCKTATMASEVALRVLAQPPFCPHILPTARWPTQSQIARNTPQFSTESPMSQERLVRAQQHKCSHASSTPNFSVALAPIPQASRQLFNVPS